MKNYFEILGIEEKFELDLDDLEARYLDFQREFHPDKAGIAEIEKSILVNEAFEALSAPISRASHILKLNGIDLENDSDAPKPDFTTLSRVLEIQEEIPNLDDSDKIKLRKELSEQVVGLLEKTALSLENQDFEKASQILIEAKYLDKITKDLRKK